MSRHNNQAVINKQCSTLYRRQCVPRRVYEPNVYGDDKNWTSAVATIGQGTHIRVCHQYMCVIIPTQFTDYQKVILDKVAIIIILVKKVAKWSNPRNV